MENLNSYFKDLTDFDPIPPQKSFFLDMMNFGIKLVLVSSGTNCGKTLSAAILILWFITEVSKELKRPIRVLVITPQTKELWSHLRRIFREHPELLRLDPDGPDSTKDDRSNDRLVTRGIYHDIPEDGFQFKDNLSEVLIRGATSRQIKGPHCDLLIVDEAGLVKESAIKDCLGRMQGICRLILLSTPEEDSYFDDLCSKPEEQEKGWKLYNWSKLDTPWNEMAVMIAKKVLGETSAEYYTDVLGESAKVSTKFLYREFLPKCSIPGSAYLEGGDLIAGLDLSEGKADPISLVIVEVLKERNKLYLTRKWETPITIEECLPEINQILTDMKVKIVNIDYRPFAPSEYAQENVKIPYTIINGQELGRKTQMIHNLRRIMKAGKLELYDEHKDIKEELKKYRFDIGRRDDLTCALMMALWKEDSMSSQKGVFIELKSPKKVYGRKKDDW